MLFEAEGGPVGIIDMRSYKVRRPRITAYFKAVISAYNSNIKLLEEIRDKLRDLGIRSSIRMESKEGETNIIHGREVRFNKPYYELVIVGKDSIIRHDEQIGFISKRKQEKLEDIVDILKKCGASQRRAVEWIKRYEYRRKGRERWIKRESPLTYEEAKLCFGTDIGEKVESQWRISCGERGLWSGNSADLFRLSELPQILFCLPIPLN